MPATKDRFAVGSADWVAWGVSRMMREDGMYLWVRDVFPDQVVAETEGAALVSIPYTINGSELVLGDPAEVTVDYVLKQMANVDLTGPIVKQEEDQRLVTAPVLVPDEPDSDGDTVTADQIERVAHLWMEKYQNVDLMHTLNNVAMPVESYIAPVDIDFPGGAVPKGSWVLTARVPDELWPDVKKGGYQGFSLMAVQGDPTALAVKSSDELLAAAKRITLSDLGEDWVVPFVSIVDQPAVPKAKWVAMKHGSGSESPEDGRSASKDAVSTDDRDQPETSLVDKLRAMFTSAETPSAEKAGRRFSNATYGQLKKAVEALSALLEEAEKERNDSKKGAADMTPEQVQEIVNTSLKGVNDSIEEIKQLITAEATQDETTEDTEATDADEKPEREQELEDQLAATQKELDDFKDEVAKRLKVIPKSLTGQDEDNFAAKPSVSSFDGFGRPRDLDEYGRMKVDA